MSLLNFTISGIKWSSFSQYATQITQYLTTIVLIKLLSPNDFGTIAMAMIIIGFLEIFKDLGTAAVVIYRKDISNNLLSSIFWLNLAFGLITAIIIIAVSPLVASFFSNPILNPILKVMSISFFISSFSIVPKALLEKKILFKKLALVEFISAVFGSIIGIISAIWGLGVWSLVNQSIALATLTSLLLWLYCPWKPSFHFEFKELRTITGYSLNLLGYNTVNYFIRNADYLLIGKFLGEKSLGHYYLAYKIMLYPLRNLTHVISRVMFPVYSKIQNNTDKFKDTYIIVSTSIALLSFPMMLGLMAVSDIFVLTIFSDNWDVNKLVYLIIILSPVGLIQSITATTGTIYQSKGKTNWLFLWGLVNGLIYLSAFFIGVQWGIIGVAVSYLVVTLLTTYHCFAIPFKLIGLKFSLYIKHFNKIFGISLSMLIFVIMLKILQPFNISDLILLIILPVMGIIFYLAANYFFNKNQLIYIFNLIKNNFK